MSKISVCLWSAMWVGGWVISFLGTQYIDIHPWTCSVVTICSYYLPGWHVAGCAELCWVDIHLADWHGILSCHQNPFPQHLWGWFYFIWQSHIHPFDLILFDERHIQPPQIFPWSSYVEFWELISSISVNYFFMCVLMTFHLLSFHSVGFYIRPHSSNTGCTLVRKGRKGEISGVEAALKILTN